MDNRQELAKRITDICNICLFDINSYIWIRSTETYKNSYFKDEFTLGGGNVVSATYIFSVINSLAKINYIISSKKRVYIDRDAVLKYSNFNEFLKSLNEPILKLFRPYMQKPKEGTINEIDAFKKLNKDLPESIHFVIPEIKNSNDELDKLWKNWRNGLAHMALPRYGTVATIEFKNFDETILNYQETKDEIGKRTEYSIEKRKITIELLIRDIAVINKWLTEKIMSDSITSEKIEEAITWLGIVEGDEMYINLENYN